MRSSKNVQTGKVYKLRVDTTVMKDMNFKRGQEFEVFNKVVYIQGVPVTPNLQPIIHNWITNNPNLFVDDTRTW